MTGVGVVAGRPLGLEHVRVQLRQAVRGREVGLEVIGICAPRGGGSGRAGGKRGSGKSDSDSREPEADVHDARFDAAGRNPRRCRPATGGVERQRVVAGMMEDMSRAAPVVSVLVMMLSLPGCDPNPAPTPDAAGT